MSQECFKRWRKIAAERPDWKIDDLHGNSLAADAAQDCLRHIEKQPETATIELKTAEQYHGLWAALLNTKLSGAMGNDPVLADLLEAVERLTVPKAWLS